MNVKFAIGKEHDVIAVRVEVKRYDDGICFFIMGEYRDNSYYGYTWEPISCFLNDADAALDYAEELQKMISAEKKCHSADLSCEVLT